MINGFLSKNYNSALLTLTLALVVVALGAYTYFTWTQAKQWNSGPTTINVTGTGEVTAVPDIATFSFSVRAEGADATAAQGASAEAVNAVMAYLKEQGVEEKDTKTSNYTLNPKYSYETKPCAFGMYCPPSDPVQVGFEVYQSITVKVRDMNKAGALLSGVGEKGATDISGLTFAIDDENKSKSDARALAIEDAKAQAQKLADQLDVRLVEMIGFYEETPHMPYYGMGGAMMDSMSARAEMAPSPEVPAGENTVTSRVTLTYKIR
jgi:uncharacterized protein